jgi:hypothetical protein
MRVPPVEMRLVWYAEKRSDEIRSQIGMRKLDKQIHKRKKIGWKIYRACHQKELPDKLL